MIIHSDLLQHLVLTVFAGLQVVTIISASDSADQSGCYFWIMSNTYRELTNPSSGTPMITYDLWIVDPRYASTGESLRDTASPSVFSRRLSEQFYWLGQDPTVKLAAQNSENFDGLPAKVAYNEALMVWNVTFESMQLLRYLGQTLLISGKAIAFYECTVGDVIHLIKIPPTIHYDSGTVQAWNGMQSLGVVSEPCDKTTMLLLTSQGVFVSLDSLLTTQKLALSEFGSGPVSLLGAVVLLVKFESIAQHIILVTNKGIFHITSDQFGTQALTINRITNKDFSKMTGVLAGKWMCDLHSVPRQMMAIAFWNSAGVVVTNINFTQSTFYEIPDSTVIIKDLQFTGQRVTFSVVMYDPASKILSVSKAKKVIANSFQELCSWKAVIGSDKYTMAVAPIGMTYFYVWNDMVVYYYFGPENTGMLSISGSSSVEIGTATDPIKQFIITLKTEIAIALSSGAMFYSKVMFKKVWKVQTTILPGSVLSSDETGKMFTVQLDSNLLSSRVPLNLSYRTVAEEDSTLKCPYKDFQMSGEDRLNAFKMDLGDEIRIWSLVLLPQDVDDDVIQITFETLNVIFNDTSTVVHREESGVSQYKETRFSIIPDRVVRFGRGNTYVGHFGFQLEPIVDDSGIVCPVPGMMFGYIYVGCSDFKQLRVVRTTGDDAECDMFRGKEAPFTYTLYSFQIMYQNGSSGGGEKTVQYDFAKYGCPITVHYSDVMSPKFELVDDFAKTVRPLDVEFVIFELNNREFGYNRTVSDVRCTVKPQNWKEMMEASPNETNMEFVWTPANYKSCYVNDPDENGEYGEYPTTDVLNNPYQILNGSDVTGLTFTHYGSLGLYIFTAVVVNPNVSFCHLSTTFAVNVIGKVVRRDFLGLYITLGTYSVLLIVFVLTTYFYYREHVYGR